MTCILLKNGNWNWILPKIEEETLKIRFLTIIQGIVYGLLIVGVVTCVSFMVLIFCVEFWELFHLTSKDVKKI